MRIQIAKLDRRQTKNTFSRWNKVVLEQLKKAGVDYFSKGKLNDFNNKHEMYVRERVGVQRLR